MIWGINFTTEVVIEDEDFVSVFQVKDAIDNVWEDILNYKARLKMLGVGNAKELTPEGEDVMRHVEDSVDFIVQCLSESQVKLYKLNRYLEYLEDHEIVRGHEQ